MPNLKCKKHGRRVYVTRRTLRNDMTVAVVLHRSEDRECDTETVEINGQTLKPHEIA